MLKIILCFLFGHRFVEKVYNGKTFDTIDRLTNNPIKGHYYTYKQMDFCIRCSKKNPHKDDKQISVNE